MGAMGIKPKSVEVDELELRINQMRKSLIQIVTETGLNSDDTLRYSQKLDKLITIYQIQKTNNKI
jgi:stage 0 sporulation regulatory protein